MKQYVEVFCDTILKHHDDLVFRFDSEERYNYINWIPFVPEVPWRMCLSEVFTYICSYAHPCSSCSSMLIVLIMLIFSLC